MEPAALPPFAASPRRRIVVSGRHFASRSGRSTGKELPPKGEAPQWTPLREGNFSLKDFMERRRPG